MLDLNSIATNLERIANALEVIATRPVQTAVTEGSSWADSVEIGTPPSEAPAVTQPEVEPSAPAEVLVLDWREVKKRFNALVTANKLDTKDISKRPKVPKGVGPWLLPEGFWEGR
jgi:hypothetical protein